MASASGRKEKVNEETEQVLYPMTILPSEYCNQVIVTDDQIDRGVKLGPFPGTDAVEKKYAEWMKHITSVKSLDESNLLICFVNNEMYFYCHRLIYKGTELVVWGGTLQMNRLDPADWNLDGIRRNELTFVCQECNKSYLNELGLHLHWSGKHQKPEEKLPEKNCKCPICSKIIGSKNHYRVHVLQHGINLSEETLYQKLKKNKGGRKNKRGRKKKVPSFSPTRDDPTAQAVHSIQADNGQSDEDAQDEQISSDVPTTTIEIIVKESK